MRLLWQSFVDQTQNAAYFERLRADLGELAAPGTSIEFMGMDPPDRDFGRLTEFRCAIQAVDNALAAEQQGYDGFIMGHFQDPGLYEARAAAPMPVTRRPISGCAPPSWRARDRWSSAVPMWWCPPECCRASCCRASAASP